LNDALEDIYAAWPTISRHVATRRAEFAQQVLRASESTTQAWIADNSTQYQLTQVPTTELQIAAVTYKVLNTVQDDLSRMVGDGAAAGAERRTEAINAAAQKISIFMDPASRASVEDLASALRGAASENIV
jgi:hypothetical protein